MTADVDHRETGHASGGCQCGSVRYRASMPVESANVCHCRMCQKAGGAPFMAFVSIPTTQVVWTRGEPTWFASSSIASRGFCRACGTVGCSDRTDDWIVRRSDPDCPHLTSRARGGPALE
ncbi:GFA family protein [Lichenihabitans psoromatis]|uniref:GFA family protein n=1 Tax=Lichenihabitans psoromatis TaxID=2528642 RepID=UPI003CCABBB0